MPEPSTGPVRVQNKTTKHKYTTARPAEDETVLEGESGLDESGNWRLPEYHVEEPAQVEQMTVPELPAYAESHNVDLGDATLKADIQDKITEAEEAGK